MESIQNSNTTIPKQQKAPLYRLDPNCYICKKADAEYLCSKCKFIKYCSVECQTNDWKSHKEYCLPPSKQPDQTSLAISHFVNLDKIGEGNFSVIYKAFNIFDHKTYAIKVIDKIRVHRIRKEADIMMEKHCLTVLKGSQYVIDIYGTFQDELSLYIQFEYVEGGELWEKIRAFGLESIGLIKYYLAQILNALEYMHSKGIVHRDIKPENILLDRTNKIKFIDFGTAKDLLHPEIKGSGNSAKGKRVYENFVGTPQYMAPECIHNKNSNEKSDIWSLGCLTFQLFNGLPPFLGGSDYLIFQKSLNEEPIFPEYIDPALEDLIRKMLKKEPEERISIAEIKDHEFFKGIDFNQILSQYDELQSQITKTELTIKKFKEKILKNNVTLLKIEELESEMNIMSDEINELNDWDEKEKEILRKRCQNLKKQFAHYYKLKDYEY